MVDLPDYYIENISIPCELEEIEFQSREIGFFKSLIEKIESDEIKQRCNFFITYSENEIEQSNQRLKDFRSKLES
jgi:hypothetical protein